MCVNVGNCEIISEIWISGIGFDSSAKQRDVVLPNGQSCSGSPAKRQHERTGQYETKARKANVSKPDRHYERQSDEWQIEITVMHVIVPIYVANCQRRSEGDCKPCGSKPDVGRAAPEQPSQTRNYTKKGQKRPKCRCNRDVIARTQMRGPDNVKSIHGEQRWPSHNHRP